MKMSVYHQSSQPINIPPLSDLVSSPTILSGLNVFSSKSSFIHFSRYWAIIFILQNIIPLESGPIFFKISLLSFCSFGLPYWGSSLMFCRYGSLSAIGVLLMVYIRLILHTTYTHRLRQHTYLQIHVNSILFLIENMDWAIYEVTYEICFVNLVWIIIQHCKYILLHVK